VRQRELRLRGHRVEFFLRERVDDRREPLNFIDAHEATRLLPPLFADPFAGNDLRDLAAELFPGQHSRHDADVLAQLTSALVSGRLGLARLDPRSWTEYGGGGNDGPPDDGPDGPGPAPAQDTAWIEIQLVDPDGKPIADQRYKITASDGRVYQGYTDSLGSALVRNLPAGNCNISFPELDKAAWG
jgi:hypothetical protein